MESTDFLGTISKLIKRADRASRLAPSQTCGKRRAFVQNELDQSRAGTATISSDSSAFSLLRLGHEASGMVSVHWKEHGEFLLRSIADFLDQGRLVDSAVTCGRQSLRVHRLVLAAFLPTFQESLEDDDEEDKKEELSFDDMADDFEDVRAVVRFIYTGTLTVSESRVERLRRLAKKLRFRGLAEALAEDVADDEPPSEQHANVSNGMVIKVEPGLVPYVETAANDCSSDRDNAVRHASITEQAGVSCPEDEMPATACRRKTRKRRSRCPIDYSDVISEPSQDTSVPLQSDVAGSAVDGCDLRLHEDGDDDYPEDRSGIYVCSLCNKCFTEAQRLSYHVTDFHKQWKPFRCQLCRKVFSDPQKLRGHFKLAHKDWKPYRCTHCPRQFAQASELFCHARSTCKRSGGGMDKDADTGTVVCIPHHQDIDARYACALCEQQFHDELSIRRHIDAAHDHWKPFACGACSQTFVYAGQLRLHLSSMHGVSPVIRCEHCPKTFMWQARLGRHVERAHDHPCKRPRAAKLDDGASLEVRRPGPTNVNLL